MSNAAAAGTATSETGKSGEVKTALNTPVATGAKGDEGKGGEGVKAGTHTGTGVVGEGTKTDDNGGEGQGQGSKAGESQIQPKAPATYDLKVVDKGVIGPDRLEEIGTLARELDLTNDQAQALLGKTDAFITSLVATRHAAETAQWQKELATDPVVGGEKHDAAMAHAQRAIDLGGSADSEEGKWFRDQLEATGLGNHRMLVRFLANLGRHFSEDRVVGGNGAAGGTGDKTPAAQKLYPGMNP